LGLALSLYKPIYNHGHKNFKENEKLPSEHNPVVSRDEWIDARKQLLVRRKNLPGSMTHECETARIAMGKN